MAMCGVRVWCAECASLDVDGFLWTNLLPGTKNKATIEVFAGHLGEESVRETTTYALSKRLFSRSTFRQKGEAFTSPFFCQEVRFGAVAKRLCVGLQIR